MGGLFGGKSSSGTTTRKQELGPAVDMSGAKTVGDDKMAARMNAMVADTKAKKAGTTLLGRSANETSVGATDTPKPTSQVSYR